MEWLVVVLCVVGWLACGYLARLLFLADLRLEAGPDAGRFIGPGTRRMLWSYCLLGPPALCSALWEYSRTRRKANRGETFAQRFKVLCDKLKESHRGSRSS